MTARKNLSNADLRQVLYVPNSDSVSGNFSSLTLNNTTTGQGVGTVGSSVTFTYGDYYQTFSDTIPNDTVTGVTPELAVPSSGSVYYIGGVLAPNGCIYFIPDNSNVGVLKFNPIQNTQTILSIPSGSGSAWLGGVIAKNGKIYCAPDFGTKILVINTLTDQITTLSTGLTSTSWTGGVLAYTGKIYLTPGNSDVMLIIDPTTDAVDNTSITGLNTGYGSTTSKWFSGVQAPNGFLYFPPYLSDKILKVNPATNAVSSISVGSGGTGKYFGACITQEGNMFLIPGNSGVISSFLILNTNNDTTTTLAVPAPSTNRDMYGAIYAPNGKIYCVPNSSNTNILIIDTLNSNTITTLAIPSVSSISTPNYWRGAVLGPDGCVYLAPFRSRQIAKIKTSAPKLINWMISPVYNKF